MGGSDAGEGPESTLVFEVTGEETGRLDVTLARLASVSRSQAQRWIDADRVLVDGEIVRRSATVGAGSVIEATPPPAEASHVVAEAIPLAILHEDDHLLVLDKPAGMVVHPAPGHHSGTLVNALLHHCQGIATIGGVERPGIVHRLDRGTSGVMVVAKNDAAHAALSAQFHDHTTERVYRAIVRAMPGADAGRSDQPIGRHPTDRKKMSVKTRRGREAVTCWKVDRRFPESVAVLLEVRPETGRTHQIRVHLASVGLPIWGDPVYGRARAASAHPLERPALHAAVLGFVHPGSGETLRFESPLPPDLKALLDWLVERES